MTRLVNYWKTHPRFRMVARTAAIAAGAYIVDVYRGDNEYLGLTPFLIGIGTAVGYAIVGALGLEPFVGIKPENVEVPPTAEIQP